MSNLCLSVASLDIKVLRQWHPGFSLLFIAELLHCLAEHTQMESDHGLAMMCEGPPKLRMVTVLEIEFPRFWAFEPEVLKLIHPHLLLFFNGPLIEFVCEVQIGVILNIVVTFIVYTFAFFVDPKHILKFISIEIAVLPFFEKLWGDNFILYAAVHIKIQELNFKNFNNKY